MQQLRALINVSIQELIRMRLWWVLVSLCLLLFALSFLFGSLSFDEKTRMLLHFGFLGVHLSGLGLAVVFGSQLLQKELDHQTCLVVLSRNVSREKFLLSKALTFYVVWGAGGSALVIMLWLLLGAQFSLGKMLLVFSGSYLESAVIFSAALFLSVNTRSLIAGSASLGIYLISHWSQEVAFFGEKVGNPVLSAVGQTSQYLFPRLYEANWRSIYFIEHPISWGYFLWTWTHLCAWVVLLIVASMVTFRRRDLV
ncbi:MAG: ABC transporter permease [Proteobacteria bacterium]|nr:ABC transporter permease [Pseudomonadota bacterium]